ncbi:Holliday junction branch migration protein RuvA [Thiorhodospira sibirica]|uniref:Holliday junction branch migration protein RuvA n=1 Tax=Thiorhodospira sibirica TaxID=154347 RepID=UPI00022C22F3|nr:Holliday junction branch migration protein RuvA [Thiorhodospira sibirica]
MIGRLRGEILSSKPPHLVLDVNGVGYEIEAPLPVFYELPEVGTQITLYTHLQVREDAQILYGFSSEAQRTLFRSLIRVNGIGAKMALAILSGMTAEQFSRCITEGDTATLIRLPGIGRKTAERLIVELRDRLKALDGLDSGGKSLAGALGIDAPSTTPDPQQDAIAALVSLGYKPQEASRLINAVASQAQSPEECLRLALKASLKG